MSFVKKVKQSLMDISLKILNSVDIQCVNEVQAGINLPLNVKEILYYKYTLQDFHIQDKLYSMK